MSELSTCVVAVSGGVDSVVLLDALVHNRLSELTNYQLPTTNYQLVVAHFDHGIREDSSSDEQFARGVAGDYELPYESQRVELGPGTSEAQARNMRYKFLRQCCKKYNAQLMTAHHQDDVLETMVINLIRGTGWRGLASMAQISNLKFQAIIKNQVFRPLLDVPKSKILEYAKNHNLQWREDSTNTDELYLRNYVRRVLLPKIYKNDPDSKANLLQINRQITELKKEIATELQNLTNYQLPTTNYQMPRHDLIMWPPDVAKEVIYTVLTQLDPDWHPNSGQINQALHFIKTGQPGKQMEISKYLNLTLTKVLAQFKNDS